MFLPPKINARRFNGRGSFGEKKNGQTLFRTRELENVIGSFFFSAYPQKEYDHFFSR